MSLVDVFFAGMIIPTLSAAAIYIAYRFIKDMRKLHRLDKKIKKAQRNAFKWDRAEGAMAVRNR